VDQIIFLIVNSIKGQRFEKTLLHQILLDIMNLELEGQRATKKMDIKESAIIIDKEEEGKYYDDEENFEIQKKVMLRMMKNIALNLKFEC
jgi:hypothetical protein